MSQESKTPRTDALVRALCDPCPEEFAELMTEGCRQLERELAAVIEDRDAFEASAKIREANAEWRSANSYAIFIEWRDGQTMTGTLVTDDPQRFIRALSKELEIVRADVVPR